MSNLQEQAIERIHQMSDMDIIFLIEIMDRLIPGQIGSSSGSTDKMQAYERLSEELENARQYFSEDFDPQKELEEALDEKFGSVD